MSRFKIGQKVVALWNNPTLMFVTGQVFTVESLTCCERCGSPCITLIETPKITNVQCGGTILKGCGHIAMNIRMRFMERCFAPLQNNADAIEYRLKVSIPELIEIKEVQHQ